MDSSSWPPLSSDYSAAALRVIERGTLTEGPEVPALEEEFGAHVRGLPVLAVNSGCAALEIALRVAGVKGTEVIVPALTFSGSVLPVIRAGGIPVVADVDPRTFNITDETIERVTGPQTTTAVAVHLHGLMADVNPELTLIEDACQAYGARIGKCPAGAFGDGAAFSLNHRKTVFAGEGGLLVCPSLGQAEIAREIRHYGIDRDDRGNPAAECQRDDCWNWKLPELSAAVARVSLEKLPRSLGAATYAATLLTNALREDGPILPPLVPDLHVHGWHKYRVLAETPALANNAEFLLREKGVPVSRWQSRAIPDHHAFRDIRGEADVARDVLSRSFLIGTEDRPLASWDSGEAELWAEAVEAVARNEL